jgi:hypothetical protein
MALLNRFQGGVVERSEAANVGRRRSTPCVFGLTLWAPGGDGTAQEKKRMAKEQRAKEAAKAIELGELPPPKKIPKVRATLCFIG